ncbi:MAG: hypothetical protein ACLF0G_15045 [Candidatus Brocadiia bacterium]
MRQAWLSDSRVHLGAVLGGYAALAAAVQVHCADLLSSDGECYLRMAVWVAEGDIGRALFGHWSPLGPWLASPLVALGMVPRYALRLWIGLWGGAAVVGVWRLAGRLGAGAWARAAAAGCGALMIAEFSAQHRVDLLLAALLLFYLDAALDERLGRSWPWALGVGLLAGAAYLAKQYALPFFAVHFTALVLLRAWAERGEAGRWRRLARAWAVGLGGFALLAAPWAAALSARYGRPTFGTAGATTYAIYGPWRDEPGRPQPRGLERPPADAPSVWQDASRDAASPPRTPSPLGSRAALERQVRFAGRNAALIVGHLARADEFRLGLVALALAPVAAVLARRRREAAFRYLAVLVTVVVFCGGYAFVFAEDARFFWFPMLVLVALAFHFADLLPRAGARAWAARPRRLLLAAVGAMAVISFGFHPVRFLAVLLRQPPPGREHRLVAERLDALGVPGPLAAAGERGWWNGLHTAYYLGAKYAGAPRSEAPEVIADEMRAAGAATLLVWGRPRLAEALGARRAFRLVAWWGPGEVLGLRHSVAVLPLVEPSGRPPPAEEGEP